MDAACRRAVEAFPFPGTVAIQGRVARRQALEIMSQADVLLLIQNADSLSSETIPSKVYEYLLIGRPILGLLSGNSELEAMLQKHRHVVAPVTAIPQIKKAILELLRDWSADRKRGSGSSTYTVAAAVDQLLQIASQTPSSGG